jgi:hypothetical protein
MSRKVILWPYQAHPIDHGAGSALKWPAPKPRIWTTKRHLDDDLYLSHLPGGLEVTPQGGIGEALPTKHYIAEIRGNIVLPFPGGTRYLGSLSHDRPIHTLGGAHAPPGYSALSAGLPLGSHAAGPYVARASILDCLYTGNLRHTEGPTHARGDGHLPQGPLPPEAPTGQKGKGAEMVDHLPRLKAHGGLCSQVCGLGGMRLCFRGYRHSYPH